MLFEREDYEEFIYVCLEFLDAAFSGCPDFWGDVVEDLESGFVGEFGYLEVEAGVVNEDDYVRIPSEDVFFAEGDVLQKSAGLHQNLYKTHYRTFFIMTHQTVCFGTWSRAKNNPSHFVGPSPCGQGGSTVLDTAPASASSLSETSINNVILVLTCEEERSGKNGMTGLWGRRICSRAEAAEGCTPVDFAIVGEPTGMMAATAERGLLVIDATAHGISGHAARNEGVNALYIALEDIQKLQTHEFGRISQRMGNVNLNVTQINAGTAHNVIPDKCDFVVDIRPTEQYTNEELLQELQAICSSELRPRNLANRSSATFTDSPLQKRAEELGIATYSSPTTSDWMRITCDAIKMGPGESSRSHRKNEFVLVEEIRTAIEQYIKFINL